VIVIMLPEEVPDQKTVEEVATDQLHGFEIDWEQIVVTTRLQACLLAYMHLVFWMSDSINELCEFLILRWAFEHGGRSKEAFSQEGLKWRISTGKERGIVSNASRHIRNGTKLDQNTFLLFLHLAS